MKYFYTIFLLLLIQSDSFAISFQIPDEWNDAFQITLYRGGGMRYESTEVIFKSKSSVYNKMEQGKTKKYHFSLSNQEKKEILQKIKNHGILNFESSARKELIHDMATSSLCFQSYDKKHCLESGASIHIPNGEKKFSEVFYFLQELAIQKSLKK